MEGSLDQVAAVVRRLGEMHHRRDRAHRVAAVVRAGVAEDRHGRDCESAPPQLLAEPYGVRRRLLQHRPLGDPAGEATGDGAPFRRAGTISSGRQAWPHSVWIMHLFCFYIPIIKIRKVRENTPIAVF